MMKKRNVLLPLLIALMVPLWAWADTHLGEVFHVENGDVLCFYKVTCDNPLEVEAVGVSSDVKGSITIPSKVKSPDNKIYSVTSIMGFSYLEDMTSVNLPNTIRSIGEFSFEGCSGITSVTIPNSVTSIGNFVFYKCTGLTSLTIPASVTALGVGFANGCSRLTSLKVESGNKVYDSRNSCNAIIVTATNELISGFQRTTIPNTVKRIGEAAFSDCENLTSISIPNSVEEIGIQAFDGCSNLTKVTLSNGLTSIGNWAFYGCKNLTEVTIPNSVETIGAKAFKGCSKLESITIGSSVKNIGTCAFLDCLYLKNLNIIDLASWCSISFGEMGSGHPFYSTDWDVDTHLFMNGAEIKELVIPEGVKVIPEDAFWKCSGLTSVIIPNSVKKIEGGAFSICSGLTSVTIPNSVTSIGIGAFEWCSGLTTVTIPNSVTSIGRYAFSNCSNLTSVSSFIQNPSAIGNGTFCNYYTQETGRINNATLYVPAGTKEKYESTDGWKEFKNIVEMVTKGDLDGKGYTDVTDVVAAISCIMEETGLTDEEVAILDMDGDGEVDVADIVKLIIEVIKHQQEQASAASARRRQPLAETVDLTQYTALQMTVTVPEGSEVTRMMLTGRNRDTHQIVCQQTGEGQYAVVVYSIENQPLQPVDGSLIAVEGASEVVTSNVMLSTRSRERAYLNSLPAATVTGIASIQGTATAVVPTVYDLQGRKVNTLDMKKGMYIINGKKVVR